MRRADSHLCISEVVGKTVDFDESSRTATSVVTREIVDSDGEVVLCDGLDLERFEKNPIVLFMHDPYYPVGTSEWWKPQKRKGVKELLAKTRFAETEDAEEIFQLTIQGVLKGTSIGMWWPGIVRRDIAPDDLRENPEWAGARQIIVAAPMMEYSHVSIPANPEALTLATTKGIVKRSAPYFADLQSQEPVIKVLREKPVSIREVPDRPVTIKEVEPAVRIKVVREPLRMKDVRSIVAMSAGRL